MRIVELHLITFNKKTVVNNDELIESVSRNDTISRMRLYTAEFKNFLFLYGINAPIVLVKHEAQQ